MNQYVGRTEREWEVRYAEHAHDGRDFHVEDDLTINLDSTEDAKSVETFFIEVFKTKYGFAKDGGLLENKRRETAVTRSTYYDRMDRALRIMANNPVLQQVVKDVGMTEADVAALGENDPAFEYRCQSLYEEAFGDIEGIDDPAKPIAEDIP